MPASLMIPSDIYKNDIENRFPTYTLTRTVDNDLITWTLRDGGNNFVQDYSGNSDSEILRKLRNNLGFPDVILLRSTTSQKNALSPVAENQTIFDLDLNQAQVYSGGQWITSPSTTDGLPEGSTNLYYPIADKTKLAGIEAGAEANQTDAEIKAQYENNANTNAYTDSEKSKLSGVEAGAQVNQSDSEIKTQYENNPDTNAFTDAEKTKLGNQSGTNTGDETAGSVKTKYESNPDTNAFTDAEKTNLGNQSGVNTGDQDLNGLALKSNVLELDNTDVFTPDADYEPATKKYVDDNSGGLGYILATWGANLQNTGRFPAINGESSSLEVSSLGIQASAQVPADGTIDVVTYYNTTGDNTTQFKIIKNGAVMYTFTSAGFNFYGRETGIGVPVATGDNVAIEYDAGTAPGNGIYTMYIN